MTFFSQLNKKFCCDLSQTGSSSSRHGFSLWIFCNASLPAVLPSPLPELLQRQESTVLGRWGVGKCAAPAKQLHQAASQPRGAQAKLCTNLMLQFAVACVGR